MSLLLTTISLLSLLFLSLPSFSYSSALNATLPHAFTSRALSPFKVTATVLSESAPISQRLFGEIGPTPAPAADLAPGVHPRVIIGALEWDELLKRYADDSHFDVSGTWSRYHRLFSLEKGPNSPFIASLAALDADGTTALYTGDRSDMTILSQEQLDKLLPLAEQILTVDELNSESFFMCAFWASVSRKRAETLGESARFLPNDAVDTCIAATVAWAKIALAHRAYHCNPECSSSSSGRAYLWDYSRKWEVYNDWYTATSGLALVYDVLFDDMTDDQKRVIRSAVALLVMKRWSWGNSETSSRNSPNAAQHPHRIFSNWAMYHSNLYISNLAIEGETDFDVYTSAVLAAEGEKGFNQGLNTRFTAMIEAYLTHAIYPDGATFEDAYSYFIAFREGSMAVVAAHRRGVTTIDTPRFRNFIHNAAQMYEPWQCGAFIGHSSGGGLSYPAHIGLFRYAYPNGALTKMLWKHRMHPTFTNEAPCRIQWHQNMVELSFFGDEHTTDAESMQGMDVEFKKLVPTSYYSPRRGLLIARNSLDDDSIVIHFDARPDAFFPGHDNADRGVFTFSAFKQTWIGDLPWRDNVDSRRHSLMHIDGQAQDEKAPSVSMMKVLDDGAVVLASANLTYAYNVQWARPWQGASPPTTYIVQYQADGTSSRVTTTFTIPESGDPRDFGWPAGDDGADIGFARPTSNMHGDPDMGFMGMYTWKRDYRTTPLSWAVRSTALVRSSDSPGYFIIADSFKMSGTAGNHVFESYMMFEPNVDVIGASSSCTRNTCKIVLSSTSVTEKVDLHVLTLGSILSYRTEIIDTGYTRLVIKSEGMQAEEFFLGFNPHGGDPNGFAMKRLASGILAVTYGNDERLFELSARTHDLQLATMAPSGPMDPIPLAFNAGLQMTTANMSSNPEQYLHPSTAPYQVVFKFISHTPKWRLTKGDKIKTCFRKLTNTRTDMFVYDCGDAAVAEGNYAKKDCTLVEQTGASDTCRKFRTDFRRRFTKGKTYFLAVSVNPGGGVNNPQFKIHHGKGELK